jgi:hypothetical protein
MGFDSAEPFKDAPMESGAGAWALLE